ncbi:hypothetical protein NEHOM01_0206 [Nematocida homosporus]|uniref:uncharacterized protein n=1 Tax=Nematocida homosporus TaxID=1912981 RepID=UPI0022209F99|nr:uncharacterized protein NEHOM01_0206 [Nematocida homosporus]KAI5184531.1 hypothetical protein NEHOM01_0206 [Nematocida homosporus]
MIFGNKDLLIKICLGNYKLKCEDIDIMLLLLGLAGGVGLKCRRISKVEVNAGRTDEVCLGGGELKKLRWFVFVSRVVCACLFRVIRWWCVLGVVAWLVLRNSVLGLDVIDGLNRSGFSFVKEQVDLCLYQDVKRLPGKCPDVGLNTTILCVPKSSGLTNTPEYVIVDNNHTRFILPYYENVAAAELALREIRRVAFIRTVCAVVQCLTENWQCHRENLVILSRVVNMFCCATMKIYFNPMSEHQQGTLQVDSRACRAEALNTANYAVYHVNGVLEVDGVLNNVKALIKSGLVWYCSFMTVRLIKMGFLHSNLLLWLSLTNGYTVIFEETPANTTINFAFLQSSRTSCQSIIIETKTISDVKLANLDTKGTTHRKLTLQANWKLFQYLGRKNDSIIRVPYIASIKFNLRAMHTTQTKYYKENCPPQRWIHATCVKALIATNSACTRPSKHTEYCKDALRHNGIVALNVIPEYEPNRTDLQESMQLLVKIGALSAMPTAVANGTLKCDGYKLLYKRAPRSDQSDNTKPYITWPPKEPVLIRLDKPGLTETIRTYSHDNHYLCRHITYQSITISGSKSKPNQEKELCIAFLDLFHDITATKLIIQNVCASDQTTTHFTMAVLETKLVKETKNSQYHFHVQTLVLDSVDEDIIYWIFSRYLFVIDTHVEILNQHFPNLGIVQILPLTHLKPMASLLLNDFHGLNEVYQTQDLTTLQKIGKSLEEYWHIPAPDDFDLHRYIRVNTAPNRTTNNLGLNKLILQPKADNYSDYINSFLDLDSLGIRFSGMPLTVYLTNIPSNSNSIRFEPQTHFTLFSVTLDLIISDYKPPSISTPFLTNPNPNSQSNTRLPPPSKHSVKQLTLHFHDNHSIAETDIPTILRWVATRFKNVTTLQLTNTSISTADLEVLRARNYWINDLNTLTEIQIQAPNPNSPPFKLPIHPCYYYISKPRFYYQFRLTAVPYTFLTRLLTHPVQPTQLKNVLFSTNPMPISTLQMIFNAIITAQKEIKLNPKYSPFHCPICFRTLYLPSTSSTTTPTQFNPKNHIQILCFFQCAHFLCHHCAISHQNQPQPSRCHVCLQPVVYENPCYLTSISQNNIILTATTPITLECIQHQTQGDSHLYFFCPYPNLTNLPTTPQPTIYAL